MSKNLNQIKHRPGYINSIRTTVPTAGTSVPLYQTSLLVRKVRIQALTSNTNNIVIGPPGVIAAYGAKTGYSLNAGEEFTIENVDLYNLWINAVTNNDGVIAFYVE